MQKVEDERAEIIRTREIIESFTGRRPRGWLGPGLTETWETPDILAEEGYEYVCDWVLDDQPVRLKTRGGSLVSVPYTQECNDVAMIAVQHHRAAEYRDRTIDQFDQLYADAEKTARIMALTVHPYIVGAPHRLRYFREAIEHMHNRPGVVFWTGEQILDWYLTCE
jgi:allantoinase